MRSSNEPLVIVIIYKVDSARPLKFASWGHKGTKLSDLNIPSLEFDSVSCGTSDSAFLTRSQVMLMLLVREPHLENHWLVQWLHLKVSYLAVKGLGISTEMIRIVLVSLKEMVSYPSQWNALTKGHLLENKSCPPANLLNKPITVSNSICFSQELELRMNTPISNPFIFTVLFNFILLSSLFFSFSFYCKLAEWVWRLLCPGQRTSQLL